MTGKDLYEIHVANVLKRMPYHAKYVYPWDQIGESTQAAWEATARYVSGVEIPAMEPSED